MCRAVAAVLLPLTTALATAVVGATVALRYRRHRHGRLGVDESRSLEAALDVLVGELRTGAHPVQAFSVAAAETGGIVADRFHTVAARARLGADVAAGLRSAARPRRCRRIGIDSRCAGSSLLSMAWRCRH
ncbi:putative transmembrane protein [Mycobacterium xenopi 4042]|uniref:Putative transmembrane protein n=1 Tax=Mycobacterium xenopi 4042 TaxID=1299334 RepID=X8BDG3_MYCXE|nr:putative transmembrane protein [Mycobacterium xenopi 4042]